jgi:hypothetical protein
VLRWLDPKRENQEMRVCWENGKEPEDEAKFQVERKDWKQQLHERMVGTREQKADEGSQGIQDMIAWQKSEQKLARKRSAM